MTFLPDVNVWLALATQRHVHHSAAAAWIDTVDSGAVAFCRVAQMGLLRLLTNQRVMEAERLSPAAAWRVYERIRSDDRIGFAAEPGTIEEAWKRRSSGVFASGSAWTDSYLAAMAELLGARLVTFDKPLAQAVPDAVCLI